MNRKAFTLIELLVVVAIIGILAAVGVVAYNGYTASAKRSATKANFSMTVNYVKSEIMKYLLINGEPLTYENIAEQYVTAGRPKDTDAYKKGLKIDMMRGN